MQDDGRGVAQFIEVRDRLGLTMESLASMWDVPDEAVRWLSDPRADVPDVLWEFMDLLLAQHVEAVRTAVDAVRATVEENDGINPNVIDILYYYDQSQYDEYGREPGDYRMVNARARETGVILESLGHRVRFRYPEDDERLFSCLASTR